MQRNPQKSETSATANSGGRGYSEGLPTVGSSTNVLLFYQLLEFRLQYWINFFLSMACLLFIGTNLVLIILNMDVEYNETIKVVFHNIEFWSTFAFSVVDLSALLFSPHCVRGLLLTSLPLKLFMALSIIVSFVPAVLISVDVERFEFASHNIEYSAAIFLALTDAILMVLLITGPGTFMTRNLIFLGLSILAFLGGIVNLVVYNMIPEDGLGEQVAHYIEFTFNMVNGAVIFSFTTDSRLLIASWIQQLMQVPVDGVVTAYEISSPDAQDVPTELPLHAPPSVTPPYFYDPNSSP